MVVFASTCPALDLNWKEPTAELLGTKKRHQCKLIKEHEDIDTHPHQGRKTPVLHAGYFSVLVFETFRNQGLSTVAYCRTVDRKMKMSLEVDDARIILDKTRQLS